MKFGISADWKFEDELRYLANMICIKVEESDDLGYQSRIIYDYFHLLNPLQSELWMSMFQQWNGVRQRKEIKRYLDGKITITRIARSKSELKTIITSKELSQIYTTWKIDQPIRNVDSYVADPTIKSASIASVKNELRELNLRDKLRSKTQSIREYIEFLTSKIGITDLRILCIGLKTSHKKRTRQTGNDTHFEIRAKRKKRKKYLSEVGTQYRFNIAWNMTAYATNLRYNPFRRYEAQIEVWLPEKYKGSVYDSAVLSLAIEQARDSIYNHDKSETDDPYFMTPVRDILNDRKRNIVKI